MTVVWHTRAPINAALVHYSLVDAVYEHEPLDTIECMHTNVQKGFIGRTPVQQSKPALTNTTYIHRAYLKNLQPGRKYCYEITSGAASSHIYSFRTSSPNGTSGAFLVGTMSNMRQLNMNSMALLQTLDMEINQKLSAFVLLIDKNESSNVQVEKGTSVFNHMPTGPTLPSRDGLFRYLYPLSRLDGLWAKELAGGPMMKLQRQDTMLELQYPFNSSVYSFDSNGVHFVTLDLVANDTLAADWLANDLKTANENRHKCPWIVVYLDTDLVNDDSDDGDSTTECSGCLVSKQHKDDVESLLYEYDVDLVFGLASGERSAYVRTLPTVNAPTGGGRKYQDDYRQPEMPVHVSLPSWHAPSVKSTLSNKRTASRADHIAFEFPRPASAHSLFTSTDFYYGMLEVKNASSLVWSYYLIESTSVPGDLINKTCVDRLVLNKVYFAQASICNFNTQFFFFFQFFFCCISRIIKVNSRMCSPLVDIIWNSTVQRVTRAAAAASSR
jgi:hypothetical protein